MTTGEYLLSLSPLQSGTALDILQSITSGTGIISWVPIQQVETNINIEKLSADIIVSSIQADILTSNTNANIDNKQFSAEIIPNT